MSSTAKPTILLIHGAWHGSWIWDHQVSHLQALGYETALVDLPCTSGQPGTTQFDDAAAVRTAIEDLLSRNKHVVVLAHSYAGPIASAAILGLSTQSRKADTGGVLGLITLAAYIFPGGMDQGQAIRDIGGLPYVDWDTPEPGLFLTKDPASLFYAPDVSPELTAWAVGRLQPQSMAANMGVVPPQAWQDDAEAFEGRLAYIRTTGDVPVPVAQQDAMVEGAGGREKWIVRSLEGSGHSPMLSRPEEVARIVDEIVRTFEKLE
ncbi:hypothetical protein LTR86_006509 [Recurvomyces mirabilis]|nr:hypothetical protein LTR86_006509 [Recurvomyces mirabilis]